MEAEAARAAYEALHEAAPYHDGTFTSWAKERSESHPYRYSAGVSINVATVDYSPDDPFTTERDASPSGSLAEESPGEQGEAAEESYGDE